MRKIFIIMCPPDFSRSKQLGDYLTVNSITRRQCRKEIGSGTHDYFTNSVGIHDSALLCAYMQ